MSKRVTLLEDPYNQPEDGPLMEFRLTYEGPLLATQRDPINNQSDPKAAHKHDIRRKFHSQLKRLWDVTPFLKAGRASRDHMMIFSSKEAQERAADFSIAGLSHRHAHYGFNFVPLVTKELDLICGLEILFLRPDKPGDVVWAGDIDNRIKTLLDSLKIPDANERYVNRVPEADEKPFFVLLEEDKLITKLSVETDRLLEPISSPPQATDARLVITVRLRPFEMTPTNMPFG